MSFASTLALAVGLLVALPWLAHLLRRSKTQDVTFPAAKLVPKRPATSAQRKKLQDRALLLLRTCMIVGLAVLGATPFVRCSRLSVERPMGASVALALVIDTSQSMRTRDGSRSRFEAARAGARELLDSLRDGDAISIVSAGTPATVRLAATTDITLVKRTLDALFVTDAATDLSAAAELAEASVRELPHTHKRVVLLSDLGADLALDGANLWAPLPALAQPAPNCGIASAEQHAGSVRVNIGCNAAAAAQGRQLELFSGSPNESARQPLAHKRLSLQPGEQLLTLDNQVSPGTGRPSLSQGTSLTAALYVRLSADPGNAGVDNIKEDDTAFVAAETLGLKALVYTNPAHKGLATGGAAITEQALLALDDTLEVRPAANIPETAKDLEGYSLFVVDDPPGLTPEARNALAEWVEKGGVVLGLLGAHSASSELASNLEPFARSGVYWEPTTTAKLDAQTLAWLGEGSNSLETLEHGGRVRLDAADLPGAQIIGRWSDGVPWIFRRSQGYGTLLTVGLPASVEDSDFPLRAGFLALLEHALSEARRGVGPRVTPVSVAWRFRAEESPSIVFDPGKTGTDAAVSKEAAKTQFAASDLVTRGSERLFVPLLAGRYDLSFAQRHESRIVTLDPHELVQSAGKARLASPEQTQSDESGKINTSAEWALLVLGLFALELGVRTVRASLRRRETAAVASLPGADDGAPG